jgi:hypothetical protein
MGFGFPPISVLSEDDVQVAGLSAAIVWRSHWAARAHLQYNQNLYAVEP